MNAIYSLIAVFILIALVLLGIGGAGLYYVFGVIIPYVAIVFFLAGFVYRVLKWAKAPVPFRITTTCGQQKSLPWIKNNELENPSTGLSVIGRMLLEVLFFRSLFRNTKTELKDGPKVVYSLNNWLWLGGLAFHWSFLIIIVRHFRFFTEPVPAFISIIEKLDSFFQVGLPIIYATDAIILAAVSFLVLRRIMDSRMRYISLNADFFPLFLILSIAVTGVWMRYFGKVDVIGIKELAIGLFTFNPVVPEGIGVFFFIHLFLVSVLIAYFPFSKLMHMGGVFLSPTRNLANNNRMKRHINPWNPKVKFHTYEEYEDEFREVMRDAGMPLDKK
ncbi:MAG: sulfate reduction electron transfer complex DsrMKJOP subunit DsrM [Candidatus Hatepunaea meridiana]|nr:sulfate reduction electron transfer complex DsrMKJOP subunit DsrM [Candidatus Hatepunaea meridiana]